MIVVGVVGIAFVMRYARKVQLDPKSSIMYESDLILRKEIEEQASGDYVLTFRQKIAGVVSLCMFIIMVVGVFKWGWDMPEIGGIFMGMAILSGLISGMKGNEICESFLEGSNQVLIGALIVGLSRGVSVVMNDAMITDTIIHGLATVLQNLPAGITACLLYTSLRAPQVGPRSGRKTPAY